MKKVYKLTSPHSNNVYIGKCGGYLSTRYAQHKYYFNKAMEHNFKHFYSSCWLFIDGDVSITEIEECEDENATTREDHYIKEYRDNGFCVVNERDAVKNVEKTKKTQYLYYHNDRERFITKAKAYYYKNREKILKNNKLKYKKTKSNGCPSLPL